MAITRQYALVFDVPARAQYTASNRRGMESGLPLLSHTSMATLTSLAFESSFEGICTRLGSTLTILSLRHFHTFSMGFEVGAVCSGPRCDHHYQSIWYKVNTARPLSPFNAVCIGILMLATLGLSSTDSSELLPVLIAQSSNLPILWTTGISVRVSLGNQNSNSTAIRVHTEGMRWFFDIYILFRRIQRMCKPLCEESRYYSRGLV